MDFETLLLTRKAGIATLTLNRPHALNAFTLTMVRELHQALLDVEQSAEVRVIVLKAAGAAFCAGADLKEVAAQQDVPWHLRTLTAAGHQAIAKLKELPQPVIAAVHGVAAGGGLGLCLACDLIVAGTEAAFVTAFAKLGLSPDYGATYHLVRLLGEKKAFELAAFSPHLSAQEALELGLINAVVPLEQLETRVASWAERLAAGPPLALQRTKRLIQQSLDQGLHGQLEAESLSVAAGGRSLDFQEGLQAFLHKRPPRFQGR